MPCVDAEKDCQRHGRKRDRYVPRGFQYGSLSVLEYRRRIRGGKTEGNHRKFVYAGALCALRRNYRILCFQRQMYFVDSCASGGGRNDLETLRRSVPLLRSDSDRTTIELRLAMTTRLVRWIPFTGAATKESSSQLANGMMDTYVLRASMLPHFGYQAAFYHERDGIDWETLKRGQEEWKELSQYFFNDFYVLTPQREVSDSQNWTVYEYFDEERDSGVIQAFRLPDCEERSYKVEVKGVKATDIIRFGISTEQTASKKSKAVRL